MIIYKHMKNKLISRDRSRPVPTVAFFSLIGFLIFSSNVLGQEKENINLGLLIEKALKQNLQIEVAKYRYEASKARISQASSLDDPQFEYKYDKINASMDAVMQGKTAPMRTFGVSQEIPFPTKLILRAQIAVKESQMAYEEYKEKEREIISQVKSLYAGLAFIYSSIDITKENKAFLEQLARSLSTQYSLGKVRQEDALKAQLEIAKMENELIMLEQKRQVTQAKINVLLNQGPDIELARPELMGNRGYKFNLEDMYKSAKDNRPELKAFRFALERARKTYSLAKQGYLPDFMVKYERMERDGELKDWAGMVGISLPIWFWQKQNFNVKEMRKELKAMEAEFKNKENMTLLEVKEAFSNVEALKKLSVLFRTTYVPQAEQLLKSSSVSYEAGQADFLNLLDSERMLLEFKLDYYKTLVEMEVSFSELERSVGVELE
jgi:outer membrane protein TolC